VLADAQARATHLAVDTAEVGNSVPGWPRLVLGKSGAVPAALVVLLVTARKVDPGFQTGAVLSFDRSVEQCAKPLEPLLTVEDEEALAPLGRSLVSVEAVQVDVTAYGVHESASPDLVPRAPAQQRLDGVSTQQAVEQPSYLLLAPHKGSLHVWQVYLPVKTIEELIERSGLHGFPVREAVDWANRVTIDAVG
jgi:hypothetical protein